MRIILLRHLKSDSNISRCFSGWSDVKLSKDALEESKEVSKTFSNFNLDNFSFYSSSLVRCTESVKLIFGDVKFEALDGLKETNFGDYTGIPFAELEKHEDYLTWHNGGLDCVPPNGESYNQMCDRVIKCFKEIYKENKDMLIVTSSGPITAIMRYLLDDESMNIYRFDIKNGHGFIIDIDKDIKYSSF